MPTGTRSTVLSNTFTTMTASRVHNTASRVHNPILRYFTASSRRIGDSVQEQSHANWASDVTGRVGGLCLAWNATPVPLVSLLTEGQRSSLAPWTAPFP